MGVHDGPKHALPLTTVAGKSAQRQNVMRRRDKAGSFQRYQSAILQRLGWVWRERPLESCIS
jgi:hypothetical protein